MPVAVGFAANIEGMAGTLSRSLARAGQPSCHLVGYSLGARTALALAISHPRLVARLTLVGVHPGLADPEERAQRVAADGQLAAMLRTRGIEAFVDDWQDKPIFASQARLPPAVRARQRRLRLAHDPDRLADSLVHMGLGAMPDYRANFVRLAMPVTLVVGADDSKFAELAGQLCELRAGTGLRRIAGCGHNPVLERPADLADVLLDDGAGCRPLPSV